MRRSERGNSYGRANLLVQYTCAVDIGKGSSRLTPRQNKDRQKSQNRHEMYLNCSLETSKCTSKACISIILLTQRVSRIPINTIKDDVSRRLASIAPRYGYWPCVLPDEIEQAHVGAGCDVRSHHPYNPQGVQIARSCRGTGVPWHAVPPHQGCLSSRTRWRW